MSKDAPRTFPGQRFYWPHVSCSAHASTLTMSDEDKRRAAEREETRATFGFGRILDPSEAAPARREQASA